MAYGLRGLNKFCVIRETSNKVSGHVAAVPQIVGFNDVIRVIKPFNEKRPAAKSIELSIIVAHLYNGLFWIIGIAHALDAQLPNIINLGNLFGPMVTGKAKIAAD